MPTTAGSNFFPTDLINWLTESIPHQKKSGVQLKKNIPADPVKDDIFSRTHVVGFMDYDPKMAAFTSKNLYKKKGRMSKWFDL